MKKSLRLALLVCAGFAGLTLAGPALAAYEPSLTIEQSSYKLGAPFTADLFLAASQNDDPSAKLTLSAPAGYGVNLNKAPGTKVGSAIAIAQVAALGGAPVPLTGDVVVGNPADPSLAAASTRCTGSPANQAVLVLNLAIEGQPPTPFPVFANKVGPLATFQVCAPYPEISSSNPSGARILLLDATIRGIFTNATSAKGYEWTTLFTPYNTATKAPNPAGTIEWRTYVGLPSSLTFRRVRSATGLKFSGALHVTGVSPKGIRLHLYYGRKPAPLADLKAKVVRTAQLPASGKYSIKRPVVKVKTYFQMRFENYLLSSCAQPSPAPQGCKGEDIAAVTSPQVRVLPPRKRSG
jgi:hypothetical protein